MITPSISQCPKARRLLIDVGRSLILLRCPIIRLVGYFKLSDLLSAVPRQTSRIIVERDLFNLSAILLKV